MNKKITFAGGWIIVHPSTGNDEIAQSLIRTNLENTYPPEKKGYWNEFSQLCAMTEASEGLPFKPERVKATLPGLELQSAYEAYLRVPTAIQKKWMQAVKALNDDNSVLVEDVDPNPPAA